jgi:DNA-binding PadR family transcriptional regulator
MSLRYALLGLLTEKPLSGYDLSKTIEESQDLFWKASTSQIYRELAKLSDDGYVEVSIEQQEGRPNKKVYYSTDGGKSAFHTWLMEQSDANINRVEFLIRTFFFDKLPAEEAVEIILGWRRQHEEKLRELEVYISDVLEDGDKLTPGRLSIFSFGAGYYRWFIEWCDQTVDLLLHPEKSKGYGAALGTSKPPVR